MIVKECAKCRTKPAALYLILELPSTLTCNCIDLMIENAILCKLLHALNL